MESFWDSLACDDAVKALRGVQKLATAPRQTVPFLGERLKPAAPLDAQKITNWIGELESDEFAVRQHAAASLLKSDEQVVATLQKVLASSPPLETRRHLKELVAKLTSDRLTAEQLRLIRAVEALERIGTAEAREVLRTLAQGASGTLPTREAEAALNRLAEPSAPLSETSDKNNPEKVTIALPRQAPAAEHLSP
jgi:hypothetical protein